MKGPDARAAVTALLAEGFAPTAIEHAVREELKRQLAPYWERSAGDGWRQVLVCAACGQRDVWRCPRPAPHCGGTTRKEVTLREWEGQWGVRSNRDAATVKRLPRRAVTAGGAAVTEAQPPAQQEPQQLGFAVET